MNTKKMRYLNSSDYMKVSAPLVVLLCVFFFKSMIQSTIESIFSEKLSGVKSGMVLNVENSDAEFIKALLDSGDFKVFDTFLLSEYKDNSFIRKIYNTAAIQEAVPEEAVIPVEAVQPEEIIMPVFTVSSVFNGSIKQYAVVNNIAVNVGSVLPDGSRVKAISEGRVLIEGQWGKQWFYVSY